MIDSVSDNIKHSIIFIYYSSVLARRSGAVLRNNTKHKKINLLEQTFGGTEFEDGLK